MPGDADLTGVIDTFTRGFSKARSVTWPYVVSRVGPLWRCHDAPGRSADKERGREYVALDTEPIVVDRHVQRQETGPRGYVVCVAHRGVGKDAELHAAYTAMGYRYARQEPFFVRDLTRGRAGLRGSGGAPVRRVQTPDAARRVAEAAGRRQIDEAWLADAAQPVRLFAAWDGDRAVGWVTSVATAPGWAWVANLYVERAMRGRGIGGSLMRALLRDDARRGVERSVLTASTVGAMLYPKVGYQRVGSLMLFYPPKA